MCKRVREIAKEREAREGKREAREGKRERKSERERQEKGRVRQGKERVRERAKEREAGEGRESLRRVRVGIGQYMSDMRKIDVEALMGLHLFACVYTCVCELPDHDILLRIQ